MAAVTRHGICSAHLLRDLTAVAEQTAQRQWASGLAGLLVEINDACDAARACGHKALAPNLRRAFDVRYDTLVAKALALNPTPRQRARTSAERQAYNPAVAFQTQKASILGYMHHLDRPMTNNQAERDLRS